LERAAVFIDGGYLQKVLKELGEPKIDYQKLSAWAADGYEVFRTYYYDCLPYQDSPPTEEQNRRFSSKQSFLGALQRLERYEVRLGRLERRGRNQRGEPIFQQKRIDLQIGLDVASLVVKRVIQIVVIISGDSDMIPAVTFAKNEGVLTRLVHGPRSVNSTANYHEDLWVCADDRRCLTDEVIASMKLA